MGWLRCGPKHIYWLEPICFNSSLEKSCRGKTSHRSLRCLANFARPKLLPLTRWKAPSIIQYHHASSGCTICASFPEPICFRTSWITRSFDRRRSLCRDERDVEKNGWHMMARGKRRMLLTGLINVTCYLLENKYDIGNTKMYLLLKLVILHCHVSFFG